MAHANPAAAGLPAPIAIQSFLEFKGRTRSKDDVTPKAFIDECESRRQAAGWTDEATLAFVRTCLRGEALQWYNARTSFLNLDGDRAQALKTNWESFKSEFRKYYLLSGTMVPIPWQSICKQRRDEPVAVFIQRFAESYERFAEENDGRFAAHFSSANEKCFNHLGGDEPTWINPLRDRDGIQTRMNEGDWNHLRAAMEEINRYKVDRAKRFLLTFMLGDMLPNWLHGETAKFAQELMDAKRSELSLDDFLMRVIHYDEAKRTNSYYERKVGATDAEETEVDAVKGKGKGKGKKNNGKKCTYCNKPNHDYAECRKRLREEGSKKKAPANAADAAPPTQTGGTAHHQQTGPAPIDGLTANYPTISGNSLWM